MNWPIHVFLYFCQLKKETIQELYCLHMVMNCLFAVVNCLSIFCELFLVYIIHILYTLDRSERSQLMKLGQHIRLHRFR